MENRSRDVAIIGMAGYFPGAEDIFQFKKNLRAGRDFITLPGSDRVKLTIGSIKGSLTSAGYLDRIDSFDHKFFNVSLAEAQQMDPHQRLALQVVFHAFENAGYGLSKLSGSNTSLYASDVNLSYHKIFPDGTMIDATSITGNLNSALAGRLSRYFNLRGGAMLIDTACSSSLVALHLACNDVLLGDSEMSIVCGVNLIIDPAAVDYTTRLGIVSPNGKARVFSADADGTVGGEAAIAVVVKRLDKAVEDGDRIHAIVKAVGVNQDGSLSASLTAPDAIAQAELLTSTWKKAGIEPSDIDLIECHGTGTRLGDPIEVNAICKALSLRSADSPKCEISSVKSVIGHTNTVAGLAGLVKAVLSLQSKEFFPSANVGELNPLLDINGAPINVTRNLQHWEKGARPRIASVSSFGLIGTNCHAVIQESPNEIAVQQERTYKSFLFPFAAKSWKSLLKALRKFVEFYDQGEQLYPADVSFSLVRCREHYPVRVAFVESSIEGLVSHIKDFLVREQPSPGHGRSIWYFPSNTGVSLEQLKSFRTYHPGFDNIIALLDRYLVNKPSDNLISFVFQYALGKVLMSAGERVTAIANGVGGLAISAINGVMSVDQAISKIEKNDFVVKNISEGLRKLVSDSPAPIGFVEVGTAGELKSTTANINGSFEINSIENELSETAYLALVKRLYEKGFTVDVVSAIPNSGRRIDLPPYQFEDTRCWIKETIDEKYSVPLTATVIPSTFYKLLPKHQPITALPRSSMTFLIATDSMDLWKGRLEKLNPSRVVFILAGNRLVKKDNGDYEVDFTNESECHVLAKSLSDDMHHLDVFITCFKDGGEDVDQETLERGLQRTFLPLLNMARAFHDFISGRRAKFINISVEDKPVTKRCSVSPKNGMQIGFLRGIISDFPGLDLVNISTDYLHLNSDLPSVLANEISGQLKERFVYYFDRKRFVQQLVARELGEKPGFDFTLLKTGAYVITGGATGIGYEISKSILEKTDGEAQLIIFGRASVDRRYEALRSLNQMGKREVFYYSVDVSDALSLEKVMKDIKQKFGKLDGVIHSAGVVGPKIDIRSKQKDEVWKVFSPKVFGTLNLHQATIDLLPDFFVTFSSLNSIFPQKYTSDYAAANAFMDAFVDQQQTGFTRAMSIMWPGWSETGMRVENDIDYAAMAEGLKALSNEEGVNCFYAAMNARASNVIVATVRENLLLSNPFFAFEPERSSGIRTTTQNDAPIETWSSTEFAIGLIWKKVLRLDDLKLADDFFDIGGHSLNGSQMINMVEDDFGVQLEFEYIYEHRTVQALAKLVNSLRGNETKSKSTSEVSTNNYVNLAPQQKGIWYLNEIYGPNSFYNIPARFEFNKAINYDALQRAFNNVVNDHDALRTIFISDGSPGVQQRILTNVVADIDFIDLRGKANSPLVLERLLKEEAEHQFCLSEWPLFRFRMILIENDRSVMLFNVHHIIIDAWSLATIFFSELMAAYEIECNHHEGPVRKRDVLSRSQYSDYIKSIDDLLKNEEYLAGARDFWRSHLRGSQGMQILPLDWPREKVRSYRGESIQFTIAADCVNKLTELAKKGQTSVFIVYMACLNVLIRNISLSDDVLISTSVANRETNRFEKVIGLFATLLVLRNNVNSTMKFTELVTQVKRTTNSAMRFKDYPLEAILDDLDVRRLPDRNAFCDVVFTWHSIFLKGELMSSQVSKLGEEYNSNNISKYDLHFHGFQHNDGSTSFVLDFNRDIFKRRSATGFCQQFEKIVTQVANDPETEVGELRISNSKKTAVNSEKGFDFDASQFVS